ncbi:hypothetical protein SDC9_43182 [bioreactor metagenome]|uniref:Uncharacterized protein n=1 Tax=bioreactor metagenome TaxID=1076179 RepID=A0A644VZS6_9ZZZZ
MQVRAHAGEDRVLVQHLIGRVLALGDLEHPRDRLLAGGVIGRGLHHHRELVHLGVGPVLLLLGLAVRAELHHERGDRVVDEVRGRPVAHALDPGGVVDLRPVLLHLDLDVHAHLTPHLDHDLGGRRLVGVVVVEEPIGHRVALVIGLLQQVAGELGVVLGRGPALDEHVRATEAVELQARGHHRLPGPQRLDDRLAVDRMGHGATYARIGQHLVLRVEDRDPVVPDGRALHLEARGAGDRGDLVGRQVAGEIVFARQQAVHPARHFRHLDEGDLLERRLTAPVVVEGDEGQRHVGLELGHHVGAGGDGLRRPVGIACRLVPGAAVGDLAAEGIEPALERHVGRRVVEAHGVLVDDLDALQRRPQAAADARHVRRQVLRRRGGVVLGEDRGAADRLGVAEDALGREREGHVLGGHLVAVVELDAFAQLQLDRLVVDARPRGRQPRHRALIAHPVAQDQPFPEVREEHPFADVRLFVPDVERVVVGDLLHRDGDRAAGALCAQIAGQQQAAGGGAQQSEGMAAVQADHRCLLKWHKAGPGPGSRDRRGGAAGLPVIEQVQVTFRRPPCETCVTAPGGLSRAAARAGARRWWRRDGRRKGAACAASAGSAARPR